MENSIGSSVWSRRNYDSMQFDWNRLKHSTTYFSYFKLTSRYILLFIVRKLLQWFLEDSVEIYWLPWTTGIVQKREHAHIKIFFFEMLY